MSNFTCIQRLWCKKPALVHIVKFKYFCQTIELWVILRAKKDKKAFVHKMPFGAGGESKLESNWGRKKNPNELEKERHKERKKERKTQKKNERMKERTTVGKILYVKLVWVK